MSPQIIELLIFAAIAFFIINKLISILGTSNDIEAKTKSSKFGEPKNLKDVTTSGKDWTLGPMLYNTQKKKAQIDSSVLIDPNNSELLSALEEAAEKIDKFSVEGFMKNVGKAWKMIIEATQAEDQETIQSLVDKRYVDVILEKKSSYKSVDTKQQLDIKISDVTFFGNSVMIKLLINAKGKVAEEWTFLRNFQQSGHGWFLSNIDQYIL